MGEAGRVTDLRDSPPRTQQTPTVPVLLPARTFTNAGSTSQGIPAAEASSKMLRVTWGYRDVQAQDWGHRVQTGTGDHAMPHSATRCQAMRCSTMQCHTTWRVRDSTNQACLGTAVPSTGGATLSPTPSMPTWMSVSGVTTSVKHSMGPIRKGQWWEKTCREKVDAHRAPADLLGCGVCGWGSHGMAGTHLPQALLGHGTEAQDLPDDGHALQDIFGRCRRGVSGDTRVCAHPCVPAPGSPLNVPIATPDSQVSRGSRAAICSGLQELERSWTSVSIFSLTSFCRGRGAGGTRDTASPQPAREGQRCLGPSAPSPHWPASPRDRQELGMVSRVSLPALSNCAPESSPSSLTLVPVS